jgi:hypothetical protein
MVDERRPLRARGWRTDSRAARAHIKAGTRIKCWEGKAALELVEVRKAADGFIDEVCLKAALPRA